MRTKSVLIFRLNYKSIVRDFVPMRPKSPSNFYRQMTHWNSEPTNNSHHPSDECPDFSWKPLYTLYEYNINYSQQTSSHISNESIPTLFLVSEPDLGALSVLKHLMRMMNNTGDRLWSYVSAGVTTASFHYSAPVKQIVKYPQRV